MKKENENHRFVSDEMRHICEDYCPHTCDTCEFDFTKAGVFRCGAYCPENRGEACPEWGISMKAFNAAMDQWEEEHKELSEHERRELLDGPIGKRDRLIDGLYNASDFIEYHAPRPVRAIVQKVKWWLFWR